MVFMTQDAVPADRNLIGNLIRPLQENSKVGAAYARQLAREDCAYLEKYTRRYIRRWSTNRISAFFIMERL